MMGKINYNQANEAQTARTTQTAQAAQATDAKKTVGGTAAPIAAKTAATEDRLQFSSAATEVGELVDRLKNLPAVRIEKVEDLRARIAAGSYQPSNEVIADAILKNEGE